MLGEKRVRLGLYAWIAHGLWSNTKYWVRLFGHRYMEIDRRGKRFESQSALCTFVVERVAVVPVLLAALLPTPTGYDMVLLAAF